MYLKGYSTLLILVLFIQTHAQASKLQNQDQVHLLDHNAMKLSSYNIVSSSNSISDLREAIAAQVGNDEFTFMKVIPREDQDALTVKELLKNSVIIILKDKPQEIPSGLKNFIPSNAIQINENTDQTIEKGQASSTTGLGFIPSNAVSTNEKPNINKQTSSEIQTKIYSQGTYKGQFAGDVRSGQGQFCFKNSGDCYQGQWANDRWNGKGTYSFKNQGSLTGNWVNGEIVGIATLIYPNGNKYVGPIKNNQPNGKGVLQTNSYIYSGDFINGALTGYGQFQFISGSQKGNVYEGEVTNGVINGKGKLTFANGDSYDGQWKSSKRSGTGTQYQGDQIIYQGQWKNDRYDGKGTYYDRENNLKIEGGFLNGDLHGTIKIIQDDGTTETKRYNRGNPL